jgi:hypothetical protein
VAAVEHCRSGGLKKAEAVDALGLRTPRPKTLVDVAQHAATYSIH